MITINDLEKRHLIYEIVMAVLALIVAVIIIVEFFRPITEEQARMLSRIDLTILIIFAIDYFYRLAKAENKLQFVKSNVFDLIAILPFDRAFRLARLARLVRLARLSRLSKATKFVRLIVLLRKSGNTFTGVLKTNGLIYMILFTVAIIILGAVGIQEFEPSINTFGDAVWWSIVTTTTVGYGDISPETTGGRVIAGILMVIGIGFLGMVTGSIATYFLGENAEDRKSIIDEHIEQIKMKLDLLEEISEEEFIYMVETLKNVRRAKISKPNSCYVNNNIDTITEEVNNE